MPRHEPHVERFRVLLPVTSVAEAQVLLPLAEGLAHDRQGELLVLTVVTVPEGHPLSEGAAQVSRSRHALQNLLLGRQNSVTIRPLVRVAHNRWEGIWQTVREENVGLLVLGWQGGVLPQATVEQPDIPYLHTPPCDVILVRPGRPILPARWEQVEHILLPVRSVEANALGLRIAHAIAEVCDAQITVLHAVGAQNLSAGERVLAGFDPALLYLDRVTRALNVSQHVDQAIQDEAKHHQVVVLGASAEEWLTPRVERLLTLETVTVVLVRPATPRPLPAPRTFETRARPTHRPIALVVDRWFAENTFHSREFADLERLLRLKEKQGLTISLGLPALNEEATVGKVISTIKSALMDEVPLLDEIVLIDSGSVDYTREIAADLGIPVYIHQEILPQHGAYHGKGEALWKSLYVLQGDIIAWVDTDIKNIHPRFVYGIVGPLLTHPHVQYVKGFYRRPLRQGDKLIAGGGGRVTELTARPLINLFFPELSGLIQPLSGEYAGRRAVLETLPFFTGYGVETGLLIDILEQYGLPAIAQVDLLERVHHNQPLRSLSKMSFAILQVVIRRLEDRHKIRLLEDVNKTMNLIRYSGTRYFLETEEILERERPPINTIPEYREKRGLEPLPLPQSVDSEPQS